MGFFDKILGGSKKEYPQLDPGSPEGQYVRQVMDELSRIAQEVPDSLEVVPGREKTFVFIGKPPKNFGIFWIQDGQVRNFRKLADEKNVSPLQFQRASEELREAYKNYMPEEKFSTTVADRTVIVTPGDSLRREVNRIVEKLQG